MTAEEMKKAVRDEREACAAIAIRRSCSWSREDDKRSQDFRDGIETAASQIAYLIRHRESVGERPIPATGPSILAAIEAAFAKDRHLANDVIVQSCLHQMRREPEHFDALLVAMITALAASRAELLKGMVDIASRQPSTFFIGGEP